MPPAAGGLMALDQFRMDGKPWIVSADTIGQLRLHPSDDRNVFDSSALRDVNANEVSSSMRELHARKLWLFLMRGVQPRGDVPGLNDPVEVRGEFFGPFPSESPVMVQGHLASTRGSVLDGLLMGSWTPFYLNGESRSVTSTLLAGSGPEELFESLVLGYPMTEYTMKQNDMNNDPFVRVVVRDLLNVMRVEQIAEGGGKLSEREIPAISRPELIESLESRGYRISGEIAERRPDGILGKIYQEQITLPPTASTRELLALARLALAEIPGWLDLSRVIHTRLELQEAWWTPDDQAGIWPLNRDPYTIENGVLVSPVGNRKTDKTGLEGELDVKFRSVHFAVDPAFAAQASSMNLEVEYLDRGKTPGENISAGFTTSGENKYAGGVSCNDSGEWRRMTLRFDGAEMRGKAWNGADFWIMIKTLQPACIRRVSLKRVAPLIPADAKKQKAAESAPQQPEPDSESRQESETDEPRENISWAPDQWLALHQVQLRVEEKRLIMRITGRDPYLRGPGIRIRGPVEALFRMKATGSGDGQIFWQTLTNPHFEEAASTHFPLIHDGQWREHRVRLYEQGEIACIRLDPGNESITAELDGFSLVPIEPPVLPEPPQTGRVVYFDSRYTPGWNSAAARIAEQFEKKGFTIVDADCLAGWMKAKTRAGAPGSVCAMAVDSFPDTIFDSSWPDCTVRQFMDAGGRVAWAGDMPFAVRGFSNGEKSWVGAYGGPKYACGFNAHAGGDVPEAPEITDEGRAWGMQYAATDGCHAANISDVTVVLARVGKFCAVSWLKTYNANFPGSGLLRYRNRGINGGNDADIEDFARVALHGLASP